MGTLVSVIIGAVVALLGLFGLRAWWAEFLIVVKGSFPIMLVCGGIIAVIAGASELRDQSGTKKEEKSS